MLNLALSAAFIALLTHAAFATPRNVRDALRFDVCYMSRAPEKARDNWLSRNERRAYDARVKLWRC